MHFVNQIQKSNANQCQNQKQNYRQGENLAIRMSSKVDFSNLLVICNQQNDFDNIAQLLCHYFPHHHHQSALFISNKYYQVHVNILFKTWTQTLNSLHFNNDPSQQLPHPFQQSPCLSEQSPCLSEQSPCLSEQLPCLSEQLPQSGKICSKNHKQSTQNLNQLIPSNKTSLKYDLMIMLVDQKQQSIINFESLDQIIQKFNPEEFVLLINTTNPQDPWIYEETILQKCNNFIQIVKEDLYKVNKIRPNWARGVLLNNQQENNDSGIFSILDRIQTTRWTTMVNVKKQLPQQKNKAFSQDSSLTQNGIKQNDSKNQQSGHFNSKNQEILPSDSSASKKDLDKENIEKQSDQEEMDEKRLEQEMKEFEDMMSQMMSFKAQSANMKNEERKQKAEQLFANMFKGMMTFE